MIGAVLACRRSEERRVGKDVVGVDLGGRRIIKKTYAHLIFDQMDSKSNIIPSNSHVLKCIF